MVSKDKTTVSFHSGILTIGGTVIEVSYKDSHIFFDFGTEYRPELGLTEESLETLLNNRLVPELKGLYDDRLGYVYKGEDEKEYAHTAVFLSHAHLDHSKMINYLDPSVPLYTMKETKAILNSLNRNGDFLIPSPFEEKGFTREMIGLNNHDVIQIGDISVEIVAVDHDAYGAAALLIRTPDQFIVYSGDLRLHGYDREKTETFCKLAKHTDLLMMEGVSISFPEREPDPKQIKVSTEQELIQKFVQLMTDYPKRQMTFNGYPANILRFIKLIEFSPRTVVLEANMAALLKEVRDINVRYYYAEDSTIIQALDPSLELPYEVLINDETEYLWQVVDKFENLQGGGLYVHSDAQPLGDYDPQYAVFLNTLEEANVEFVRLSLTGHAFEDDLNAIIQMIEPKLLVPIHTLKPEKLKNPYGDRILPNRGDQIIL